MTEIKEIIKSGFTGLRALVREKIDLVHEQEKRIDKLEDKVNQLENKINAFYNIPFIKYMKENPIKSTLIVLIIFLILSGLLSFDEILQYLLFK